jgi:tetratricopeptide (TPR) repeat protein
MIFNLNLNFITMKSLKLIVLIIGLLLFNNCKEKTAKSNPALASIDFLRGDLLLCGDGQFGELKFSLSCNYETREIFDLAVALLHSFQYTEAEKAFVKVIDADPNCSMAYWGIAMSIYHAAWFPPSEEDLIKGSAVLKIAKELSMDEKQRDYINAIDAFYTDSDTIDHKTRAKRFENKMEQIHLKYPEDIEAAIFYSLALFSTRDRVGKEYANERKAGEILEGLFEENQNHPGIAHYIIHNYDNPVLAHKGLKTARRYAKIAPSSSHAQHMPSHIFTMLGIWQESIDSNIQSSESARCYAEAAAFEGSYFEELHSIDYLVYAYLQKGDNINAEDLYNLINKRKTFHPTNIDAVLYPLTAIPARLALENKNWNRAANLKLQEIDLKWEQYPWQEAIHHFAIAIGAVNTNDFNTVKEKIETLKALHQNLIALNDKTKAIPIKLVEIQIKTVQAWLNFRQNDIENGLALMKEASEIERHTSKHPVTPGDVLPAIEMLGDMFLELNKPEEALLAYEENLKGHPNRFNGLYGAAVAAKKSGDLDKAAIYFNQLIKLTTGSNSDRPELAEAKQYITEHHSI